MISVKKILYKILDRINNEVDYIIEEGVVEDWIYKKWASGRAEAVGSFTTGNIVCGTSSIPYGGYRTASAVTFATKPSNIFITNPMIMLTRQGYTAFRVANYDWDGNNIQGYISCGASETHAITVNILLIGKWK